MTGRLLFLPLPRTVQYPGGTHILSADRLILITGEQPQAMHFAALRLQKTLKNRLGLDWEIVASPAVPEALIGLRIEITPAGEMPPQGYDLSITPDQLRITANDMAGAFYGVCTLIQIVEQSQMELPCVQISDWPDFPARGVMLDISRDKVPTMKTLYELVDMLASWKINQFQLYTEHTFAYRRHPHVWAQASPVTAQEILDLDAFCKDRCVELVPNQNSFGHMNRWLKHPEYKHLAEVEEGFQTAWGYMKGSFSLAPLEPGSLELVTGLYDELLPHFSSRMFNVGCDETFDLGQGRSHDAVAGFGAGRIYLDFLMKIYREVKARGFTLQYWGDIALQHPDLIAELPPDAIALDWGYEAGHPFEKEAAEFKTTGIPFYVCPGTSSWNSLAGRTENALMNLLSAAENGLKHGAIGYLNTDWGDNGHWQVLPVSYLGYAAGAAYSWALEANRNLHLPTVLDQFAFQDQNGVMGQLAYDLGNVYRAAGFTPQNSSILFDILQRPLAEISAREHPNSVDFHSALEATERAIQNLDSAKMDRPDARLIINELDLARRMLRHACWRGLFAQAQATGSETPISINKPPTRARLDHDLGAILSAFISAWMARNRPGGMIDSLLRFEPARADYQPR